jgi:hypothetical protein
MPVTRPPVSVPYDVAFNREVNTLADSLVNEALAGFMIGTMSIEEVRAHASALYDKRDAALHNFRSLTAIDRPDGLKEAARAQAGYRLHEILDRREGHAG